jgi:hypothetical protein
MISKEAFVSDGLETRVLSDVCSSGAGKRLHRQGPRRARVFASSTSLTLSKSKQPCNQKSGHGKKLHLGQSSVSLRWKSSCINQPPLPVHYCMAKRAHLGPDFADRRIVPMDYEHHHVEHPRLQVQPARTGPSVSYLAGSPPRNSKSWLSQSRSALPKYMCGIRLLRG